MKPVTTLLALCLLLVAAVCATPVEPAAEPVVAFVNVHVVPMDSERVLENQTVVIDGDRIVAVGPANEVEVPDGATRIDGTGKYLMPGLAEMHGHIPPPTAPQDFIDNVLFLYVASGITTVRGMLGHEGQLELREQANSSQILAPTLYLAGPSFNGNSISSPEQAVAKVRQQKAEGWDLLKIHPGLTLAEYDAMAETAAEEGIRFGGHVPQDVGLLHAIEMGQETFDHLDGYVEYLFQVNPDAVDEDALTDLVDRTINAGAWVVPTMALWEVLYGTSSLDELSSYPELKYFPPQQVQGWISAHEQRLSNPQFDLATSMQVVDARMRVLAALNEAGAGILMGTDAPQQFSVPGFSLHRELERMEDAGMTPYEILRTGTHNVGQYFATTDNFGHVAEGHRADLILVRANPLADIANVQQIDGVMVRGNWHSQDSIQDRLDAIAASYGDGSR